MSVIFDNKESVFFVGGRGTKAGDAYAGGCTKEYWGDIDNPNKQLSDVMGTNGEPVSGAAAWDGSQTACVVSDNGSGKTRITKTGAFGSCEIGQVAYFMYVVPFSGKDGRYEVIAVNANYIDIECDATANTGDVKVGGAFDCIQNASDETTATFGLEGFSVHILTNKTETLVGTSIDIDSGGGLKDENSWKRIIGVDSDGTELEKLSYTLIDGDNQNQDCFVIDEVDGISFHHIHAYNPGATFTGFLFPGSSANYNLLLKDCKGSGGRYGVKTVNSYARNFAIMGGEYEGVLAALLIQGVMEGTVQGADLYSPGTYVMYVGYYGVSILNNVIRSDGTAYGLHLSSNQLAAVNGNTFYNVTNGILANSTTTCFAEQNNIFILAVAATGKFLIRNNGAIMHSNYSCGWAMDGAPSAANRWGEQGIGPNSIEADPLFVDAENNDFRLRMNSPCRRTGKPTLGQL